jgi:hypothetical protein
MGLTNIDSISPDHQFGCYLNGNPIGNNANIVWDGQRSYTFESDTFPSASLQHGKNEISFITRNTGVIDRAALNWIECIYPFSHKALDDKAIFKSSPAFDVNLSNTKWLVFPEGT